ncbi:glycosaminoglycan xylosylkinase isoform X2 [Hemiscyllium ocellatum]|uniref:glycosaminoglycan xylosylkinase isoform X2 n=1 Tax=Hemiscyllium ocellatum TaxID=170820 RepID=UPI00296758B2|nr:glycosaminoglycan xylosylkinase isoform X2 [Hemiscyllium ocellatum]
MKLKQRVVLLAILLVIFIFTKVFLIDNSDSSAANREDQHSFQRMMDKLKIELNPNLEHTLQSPWEIAAQWVVPREVYPEDTPELGAILHAMATKKIIKADVGYKGTQLKALLVLEGGQKVVFKPKRYSRSYVVEGEPYAGYDRHNAEVSAFHLDRILGLRRAPVVVGRYVNLHTEIKPVASEQLLSTFLTQGNNSCFYGKCYYCRESEPACADGHIMEGSVILWLPDIWPLQKHRHPWGRTYREGKLASFGNPSLDERSILAAVYQCCIIRVSTWNRLNYLKNGVLSTAMRTAMSHDPINPVLTDAHLDAMDRRLMAVIATIKQCIEQFGTDSVLVEDRMKLSHLK